RGLLHSHSAGEPLRRLPPTGPLQSGWGQQRELYLLHGQRPAPRLRHRCVTEESARDQHV
ncbi:MAG: hypothetical protein ACKPB4_18690, partial [Sphaerospermopsis kisseleviana]